VENGTIAEYLAMGDTMLLPSELEQPGYSFTGWYTAPDAAAGNGAVHTETQFNATGTVILYGNWIANTYYVEFKGVNDVLNLTEGEKFAVTYNETFRLPIPVSSSAGGDFAGWYTGPGSSGEMLTDSQGNGLTAYTFARDTVAYPFFDTGVLSFELQADGTYLVSAGPNIANVSTVRIPEYYKTIPVTAIAENAFAIVKTMKKLEIPATIQRIGVGALPTYSSSILEEIVVYTNTIQQNYEIFYSSHDGALLRHDMGTIFLEVFPRAKTGEYTIPDHVDVIRDKVFRYSKITRLTVGTGVNEILRLAFYGCTELESLEFKTGGTEPLTIDPEAFYNTNNLKTLRLPARMTKTELYFLDEFTRLVSLEVEAGGIYYSSFENMICNAVGDTILYAPLGVSDEYTIPVGIRAIGPSAFANRVGLTKVIVPNYVISIGESAFAGCSGMKELVIEGDRRNDLTIEDNAFANCVNMSSITFRGDDTVDQGVITVGDAAFAGNVALKTVVYEEGSNVASLGARAFADCKQLGEAVLPATMVSVGNSAFAGCEGLLGVSFAPNGLQVTFGSNVFEGCKRLASISLPATIGYFDGSVFSGCDAITQIIVDEANPNFVAYKGALYTKDHSEILFYPKALDGDLSQLHPDLEKLGNNVFQGNLKIKTVHLSNKIRVIGAFAFAGCAELTEVTFAEGTTALTVGAAAFADCTQLTGMDLPACTTVIGDSAFEAAGLTSFVIPESVTSLGAKAFNGTKISQIVIPANVERIGDGAFANCTELTTVTFAQGTKPLALGTVENAEETNGLFMGTGIQEFTVPDRATCIGGYAFYQQAALTGVTFGKDSQVTAIGQYAFAEAANLSTVTLGEKLENLGKYAFYKTKLTAIVIPATVAVIDVYALANTNLETVTFASGETGLTIGDYAFANTMLKQITLPARLEKAYSVETWSVSPGVSFKTFYRIFQGTTMTAIKVESGAASFTAIDGVLYECNAEGRPEILLYCPKGKTGKLTIPKEVRKVESGAFYGTMLSSITFEEYAKKHENYGKPLLEIGNGSINQDVTINSSNDYVAVFTGANLQSITLPSHLQYIGVAAFYNLTKSGLGITFNQDAHLEAIAGKAFHKATGLTTLALPAVDSIGVGTFQGCTKLTDVTFGKDSQMKKLPQYAFYQCTKLTTIEVPASVTLLDIQAFANCTALSTVTFANGSQLKEIGTNCFQSSGLKQLVMPDSVELVGSSAFASCTKLKTITLSRNLQAVVSGNSSIFASCTSLENVFVSEGSAYFKSVDGVLYDASDSILYCFPAKKDPTGFTLPDTLVEIAPYAMQGFQGASVVLPDSLETISNHAFAFSKLTEIHIPKNVQTIGNCAFHQYKNYATTGNSLLVITFAPDSKLKSIGANAFEGNKKLVKVELPDNVQTIGANTFSFCEAMEDILLPAALEALPNGMFANNSKLKSLVMQEGLQTIGDSVIQSNTVMEELTIPSTVTSIGMAGLQGLKALKTLTFAEGSRLESLGGSCFANCTLLERVVLPACLKTIGTSTVTTTLPNGLKQRYAYSSVFSGCTALQYADMSACVMMTDLPGIFKSCPSLQTLLLPPNLVTIGEFAFGCTPSNNSSLSSLKEIRIPASVTYIGGYAFSKCTSLERVIFEEGSQLTELGAAQFQALDADGNASAGKGVNIFADTPALEVVQLPQKLTLIGIGCFENSGVSQINMPEGVTTIGARAFKNCVNISDAGLGVNLQYLGDEAFWGCAKLENAELTFGLEYLGAYAFAHCALLKKAYIPGSVTGMLGNPYLGCTGIEALELDPDNVDFVVVDDVLYDKTMYTLLYYPAFLTAQTFQIPETVHEIAVGAFSGAQLREVVIPERITVIQECTFQGAAVESVKLHRGITYIGDYAFEGCANLKTMDLYSATKYAGHYAFANCTSLAAFTFEDVPAGKEPYTIGTHFFDGCTSLQEMVIPNRMTLTSVEDNYSVTGWATDLNGAIPAYMFANSGIVRAVIPERIQDLVTIGVFSGCKNLETVIFEAKKLDTRTFGEYYFQGCSSLKSIVIPAVKDYALQDSKYLFADCTALEHVTIYTTDTSADTGKWMFQNCTSLTDIELWFVNAFAYDEQGNITDYAQVTEWYFTNIYPGAFTDCASLKKIPLCPDGLVFHAPAFAGSGIERFILRGVARFTVYSGVTVTDYFAGMPELKEIWIDTRASGVSMRAESFANLDHDVNIYFYNQTQEEVMKACNNKMEWLTGASEKAHFYFKDTMPEDVQWPDELMPAE